LEETGCFFFGVFKFCFFTTTATAAPMEGSEEFSADHRSLENEMGSWDLPFFLLSTLLFFALVLLLWRFNKQTDEGSGGD
jgi:hypothetical protein